MEFNLICHSTSTIHNYLNHSFLIKKSYKNYQTTANENNSQSESGFIFFFKSLIEEFDCNCYGFFKKCRKDLFITKLVKSRRAFTKCMVWFIVFGQLRMKDKMSFQNPILSEHYLEGVVLKTHLSLNALSDTVLYVIRNYFKIQFLYRKRNNG